MMKRKFLSLLLCALLALSLCVPAFAADESLDAELTRVTLAVKKTLSIGDQYTDFSGNVDDMGALRYWSLDWSDSAENGITVLAASDGTVMQYSASSDSVRPLASGSYVPSFSSVTRTQAKAAAEKFLGAVLPKGESAQLTDDADAASVTLGSADHSFTAQILLNGVPSPNQARIQVSSETGKVTWFSRSDCYEAYVNDVPSAVPAVSASAAAEKLAGLVDLELQYVLPENGDGSKAVLRYAPAAADNYYVDAQSGALVNLTDAWKNISDGRNADGNSVSTAAQDAESPDEGAGLSDAEQAAVEKLQGVLSKSALDAAARKVTALGLGRYTLTGANYAAEDASDSVDCTLTYTRKLSYSELENVTSAQYQQSSYFATRVLKLNARTGALLEGWSYCPWCRKDVTANRTALQSAADSFLALCYPDYAGKVALTDGEGADFQYDRKENGYFFHGNGVEISMDPSDGSVAGFSANWNDKLTFQPADGIISAAAAKSAYCGAYAARLGYQAYPVSVNVSIPIWKTYADCCGYVAYRYVLGYTYETDGGAVLGIDAKTGKPVTQAQAEAASYTDIAGSPAEKQIRALADAGIGFGASRTFKPAAQLTQKDMLVLLLNSCGYSYDADALDDADTLDSLYSSAWSEGFLPRGSRSPDHPVTRLELVKAILDASPYGPAAKLTGIFVTSFADAAKIPADCRGYAAIAKSLGLIRGNKKGQFVPNALVNRQSAAVILYNYMSR